MKRLLVIALVSLSLVPAGLAASASSLHARLVPLGKSSSGLGTFAAQIDAASSVRWQLALRATGPATHATLRIGPAGGPSFVLCKPCALNAKGVFVLTKPLARALVAKGGEIVVATRAHPKGALHGTLRRG
jgi:hypothetical protein